MRNSKTKSGLFIFALILTLVGLYNQYANEKGIHHFDGSRAINASEYPLSVKFIDVGQGDSELVLLPNGKTMLIDAGEKASSNQLLAELKNSDVETIDYLIATHPHADHIGGMKTVVKSFKIENVYMPRCDHNSQTYLSLLEAISDKNLKINTVKAGLVIFDEPDLKAEFLAPNSDTYKDINNYSAVLKLTYKKNKFIFCGDAEALSEKEMLSSGFDLSADILKVGHHGSTTSTTSEFLDAVNPSCAIISCGINNSYQHPHVKTLEKLNAKNIKVLRTDEMGTITIYSDGERLTAETGKDV